MKITDFKKGAIIRRKRWEDNILISLNKDTGIVDFYINGVVTGEKKLTIEDITSDDWELIGKSKQVWKPEYEEEYFLVTNDLKVTRFNNTESATDICIINSGNCFKTEEEARHMAQKLQIITQLRKLSNIDFYKDVKRFYMIAYEKNIKKVVVDISYSLNTMPFNVYFATGEDCQKAIEIIGEENLKKYYFDVEN